MAARPSASPGPVHQENTSTSVLAAAIVGAVVTPGAVVGVAVEAQAVRIIPATTRIDTILINLFIFFSFYLLIRHSFMI
jgi:hypothetical protein